MTATTPQIRYDVSNANPACHLKYSWTGWPSKGTFDKRPAELLATLVDGFQKDGLRLIEHCWTAERVQLMLSAAPTVSPTRLAQRVKGRLDHAIRTANLTLPFSRKLAVRSLGERRQVDVEKYIREQVCRRRFTDSGNGQNLKSYSVVNANVDLVAPTASARGRYWYNLHLVLVTAGGHLISNVAQLCLLRETCDAIAGQNGHAISSLSLRPDHLHIALRGNIEHSPAEIGRCFQNSLAAAVGNDDLWVDSFYVGSFGEYDVNGTAARNAGTKD